MTGEFDRVSVPDRGEVVEYDGSFRPPDAPIVPVAYGSDEDAVRATRRVLDAAAEHTGREVRWMRVYVGSEARERYGVPLPRDTIRAFRRFRVGLVGPLAATPRAARTRTDELRRRVGLDTAVDRPLRLPWVPATLRTDRDLDVTVFRDITEDAAAGIEFAPGTRDAEHFREFLLDTVDDADRVPAGPTGYGVRPISAARTESLIDHAMGYAFDRDRRSVAIVHQGDRLPASEGSFREWARDHIADEYADGTVDEATFREELGGRFPDDEVVVLERRTDVACRDLVSAPDEYDVLVAPSLGGRYVSAVAAAGAGLGRAPGVLIGDGRVLVASPHPGDDPDRATVPTPIVTMLSGSILFEFLGWNDAAQVVRNAISAALSDGILPRALARRSRRGEPATATDVTTAIVDRVGTGAPSGADGGGVGTTPDERTAIQRTLAGIYNTVFDDRIDPRDVHLNQLLDPDDEADIYLPEVGLNFAYWRRWSVERRLEVILHELAHVEEEPGELDHGPEFYDRFVEIVDVAAAWEPELEDLLGEPVDFDRIRRLVVESVHEDTVEPAVETVADRQRLLRERFDIDAGDHY